MSWIFSRHDPAPRLLPAKVSREVQPELLDRLPHDSPAALASRRDLRIINHLQGNTDWFHRVLDRHHRPQESILEIGAGGGELGRSLRNSGPKIAGLDLAPRPPDWPASAPWFQTDVLRFPHWADYPVVLANLFFHHFDSAGLAELGAALDQHTRLIVASEPLRGRRTSALLGLICPMIRAHPVTRHDGRVSIAAGFRRDELPRLLKLSPSVWRWRVDETWLGASRLIAERRP